jgi:hypothetical protein
MFSLEPIAVFPHSHVSCFSLASFLFRCVSVNEVVCHNCPLSSDPPQALKDGDLVKIDTGVHVDGA